MQKRNDGERFELIFKSTDFRKGDILNTSNADVLLKVVSRPKAQYLKWYWKVLNVLTFKLFFNVKYSYTVETIDCSMDL